ncbi:MAG: glutamate--tRNA ligase [Spirochaetes bacterium]|nr:glutamate--tRNA ligase [Spirochaetota bacterium]
MRVRFAPSPTGFLHIGNARTAIINHLIAKKYNADLILRIEDTDMERSTKESEKSILEDLKWLGIEWTEGPDKDGGCGPYRQSERFDIYKKYSDRLVKEGKAYYCYCSAEELDEMRAEALETGRTSTYNGKCRSLSAEEKQKFTDEGRKPTIRFRVEENHEIKIRDLIKGEVIFNSDNIGGDFIIVRSDGVPVYNYIVVIDDLLMKITHVIRGEDHLSNTPKQILIAEALGFERPVYAHMALVMGDDKKKLSKRHGITSVALYRSEGYLPEALVNYISMLGWASETGEEILKIEDIISQIDLDNLAKSAAVFDFKKLKWMNANYIRSADDEVIYRQLLPFLSAAGYDISSYDENFLRKAVLFSRNYCELLSDIGQHMEIFLNDKPAVDGETEELLKSEAGQLIINSATEVLENLPDDSYADQFVDVIKEKTGLKGKNLFMPCRAVITGRMHGPDLADTMKILGRGKCLERISYFKTRYPAG